MDEPVSALHNRLSAPFWEAAQRGHLMLPWCVATERHFWPPSPTSPFKTAGVVAWRAADADGILIGMVVYRRSFQKAFADRMPYGVGLVESKAGPRLQVHVRDPDSASAPRAGDQVTITFAPVVNGGPRVPIAVSSSSPAAERS